MTGTAYSDTDPLPSWNAGTTKQAIVEFVSAVSDPANADFVDPSQRVATFDNDGTLWAERPYYIQLQYALDTLTKMAGKKMQCSMLQSKET